MDTLDFQLLKALCQVFAPSGNEGAMKNFIIEHVEQNSSKWVKRPDLIHGPAFQDCLILKFGNPKTAIFAHMDSIGFTVRYENQLVPIGSPETETGFELIGQDAMGPIECKLKVEDGYLFYDFGRGIQSGTELVFQSDFRETEDYVQSCYLDNRLGVFSALKVAETLTDGLIVFTCGEEHRGGSVPFLCKFIYENYGIRQSLVCDITWVTEGVRPGDGVAISMRDMSIPRRSYVDRIIDMAKLSNIPYQIEVERNGGSDGREIQASSYPIDWCFIGAAEEHVHSPDEKVQKNDIRTMIELYKYLMENL